MIINPFILLFLVGLLPQLSSAMKQSNHSSEKLNKIIDLFKNIDLNKNPRYTTLFEAAENGCCESVLQLIHQGHNINARDHENTPVAYFAASNNHIQCLDLLIKKNALINVCDNTGWNPLMIATVHDNCECVQLLISAQANINIQNKDHLTPLSLATLNNKQACLKLLLENNALVNHCDQYGVTSLMHAIRKGHSECLQLLINHNADITLSNNNGNTAIMFAVYWNNRECFEMIFEAPFILLYNFKMGKSFQQKEESKLKKELRTLFTYLLLIQKRIKKQKKSSALQYIPKPLIFKIAKLLVDEPFKQQKQILNARNKTKKCSINFAKNNDFRALINKKIEILKKAGVWQKENKSRWFCTVF